MKSLAPDYPDIEVRVYTAGGDTEYLSKYGAVTSSMLVINESVAITDLSKKSIHDAFKQAQKQAGRQ